MSKQQKKNVAALSYSSLHEKLGEANRELKAVKTDLVHAKEDLARAHANYEELFESKRQLHLKKEKLLVRLLTVIVLFFVLLIFTLTK